MDGKSRSEIWKLCRLFWLAAGVLACVDIAQAVAGDPGAAVTWEAARIVIPPGLTRSGGGCEGRMSAGYNAKCLADIPDDRRSPVILFMHGCGGYSHGVLQSMGGYSLPVFAPDSFARPHRKKDCRISADKKGILRLRLAEADYALGKLGELPWIDRKRIILAGFSEGGVTVALSRSSVPVARIILGWTCNSLDPWWRGVRGPAGMPVLAVVGTRDRYHQNRSNRGDCSRFLKRRPHSESVVIPGATHDITGLAETGEAIRRFLAAVLKDAGAGLD